MLHRMVSRSAVVFVATAFLASCEDNTTGTPLPPPDVSTAYTVTVASPPPEPNVVEGLVSPNVVFLVSNPDGTPAAGVPITFTINQTGLLQNITATSGSDGLVSPGEWHLGFRAGPQRLVASPALGTRAFVTVTAEPGPFFRTIGPPLLEGKVFLPGAVATDAATFTAVDQFNNRVAIIEGDTLQITVTALEGTLPDGGTLQIDEIGNVYAGTWTLAGTEGPQRLVASYLVDGLPKADTVTVEAFIPPPPEEE